ncbi:MAG: polyprenyl synthetase family protein [Bacteroidetes bacterium]|nr:MAG: polyprenyl synthetase family protein [Bacteroidota bacterium]
MLKLEEYAGLIESELQKRKFPESPTNLYDPLRYFMTLGGKRIRPVLALMGGNLFGASFPEVMPAAMAIEYFHNFSLIHDDIMDEAPLRRGKPTVHERWGRDIAILSGDVLLVKAYQELNKLNRAHVPDLLEVFNRTAVEVCEGQQMDMDFESREDVTREEYLEMIRLKTSVLLGCSLEMGAIVAGAAKSDCQHLYDFGMNLGIAFQIQDDLLDLYGDPEKFGKQAGGDIIAGKKTILLIEAVERAQGADHQALNEAMKLEAEQRVEAILPLFEQLGIRQMVIQERDEYNRKALEALEAIQRTDEEKSALIGMMNFLKAREL